jgi:hypothetical protein
MNQIAGSRFGASSDSVERIAVGQIQIPANLAGDGWSKVD